jgi:putative Mg2+ transporter-C (MgtC) family protein
MAGLRTNALVSLGAAGFVVFSMAVGDSSPTRVAAQVVSGIGFLGAGVILREGINIRGLNTAATLWCSAMVGTFAGGGQLVASVIAAAFVLLTNLFLRPLVALINRQPFGCGNRNSLFRRIALPGPGGGAYPSLASAGNGECWVGAASAD